MEGLTEQQLATLVDQVGKQSAAKIEAGIKEARVEVERIAAEAAKNAITKEQMETKINEVIGSLRTQLQTIEDAAKEQGKIISEIKENTAAKPQEKSLEDVLRENAPKIKTYYDNQAMGALEINLKTAGVTSIGNSILPMSTPPNSPYLPGAGGPTLDMFGLIYNPNFILNRVRRGRTTLANMPWANEISTEGAAAFVQEGGAKPLWNTRFKVEMSTAKKIAAMTVITEEFDQDLPGFTTLVYNLLQDEVSRKWDDAVYTSVIGVAKGYTITGLNGKVDDANLWDAAGAGLAQIGKNNYTANLIALNPVTFWLMQMNKSAQDRLYNLPPFMNRITGMMAEANKVAEGYALVGDISQYRVDVYKDLVLKIGWNLDDFQRNQWSVVAEVRYHDYISDNRKNALAYYNLETVRDLIDSGS